MAPEQEIRVIETLRDVSANDWNRLAGHDPCLRHAFLLALEETGCASAASGWSPRFLTLRRDGHLAGAMPLYLKSHSYGEYVFDWAWADAYHRAGLRYYPKLLCAVPFTPAPGSRLLAELPRDRGALLDAALELAHSLDASSLHCLFPNEAQARECESRGLLLRHGMQFHWENAGYGNFEDFLAALTHAKRKNIRQERRKVREAGVSLRWFEGRDIGEAHWRFFHACYEDTYRAHRSTPYLNLAFFLRLAETMPENVLLLMAETEGRPIASALFLRGHDALLGRYWGATRFVPGLHFEACYYQAIEYCIDHGLQRFEGGAQGEHKLARGLMPVRTWSAHWLAHPEFSKAVERYLRHEARGMAEYIDELHESAPFRKDLSGQNGDSPWCKGA
jgi:uncharacterized protein